MRTQQGSSSHVQVQRVDVIITVSTGRCRPGVISTGFYRRSVRRGSICKHVISLRANREFARSSSAAINTTITLSTIVADETNICPSAYSIFLCSMPCVYYFFLFSFYIYYFDLRWEMMFTIKSSNEIELQINEDY